MIHSFLMIGQSNMAGRGFINEVEPIRNPHIKVLRNGRWHNMFIPVNCDRSFSGISLAESFADAYHKEHGVDVGLIPCADGGTQIRQWEPGSLLYDHAVMQTRLAERTSTLVGVLWHQGESDCKESLCSTYMQKFQNFYCALKRDLNLDDVPFIIGGLGDFLKNLDNVKDYVDKFNEQLQKITEDNEMIEFVSAEGLSSNPDNLHFNAKSLREFGLRYYAEFKKIENKSRVFIEKPFDDVIRTDIELL